MSEQPDAQWVYSVRSTTTAAPGFWWVCEIKRVVQTIRLPWLGTFELVRTVHQMYGNTGADALAHSRNWVAQFGAQHQVKK